MEGDLPARHRPRVHDLARDAAQQQVDTTGPRLVLDDLVLDDIVQAELPLPTQHVEPDVPGGLRLVEGVLDLGGAHRRIDRADVDRPGAHRSVEHGEAVDGHSAVEPDEKVEVGLVLRTGRRLLPDLALVPAEVGDDEGLAAGEVEQALARGVDGEAAEIDGDPAAVQAFGDCGGRSRSAGSVAAHDAGLVIPPSLSSTLALLFGFSDGPWRATRKWGQAASYRQRDYLRDEVLPGELDSVANSLADYALVCRAVLAGRGSGGAPPELDSPMEEPLLAFPLLRRAGHDTRSALSELGRYADLLTDAEASSGPGSEAADFVLNSLAEYGRYWHLMALLRVPIDSPFVLTYEERDALTVRWPFNRIALDVVTADAGSNHVTLRVPDASARLLAPRLVSTATGRSAELITTSTETRELLSFYTWDRERTERVSFRVLLAPTLGVSVLSAAVFALQIGLSALLYTKGAASLSELALVAGPVGFAASLLLLREPSTLAVRLRRTSTWAILGALVVLLVITTWQAYQLLDTPAHPVRSNVSVEE